VKVPLKFDRRWQRVYYCAKDKRGDNQLRGTKILCTASVLLSAFLITGCVSSYSRNADRTVKEQIEGTVTVWAWGDNAEIAGKAAVKFTERYSKTKIDVKKMSKSEVYAELDSNFSYSKEIPDMLFIDKPLIQEYMDKQPLGFLDLTSYMNPIKDRFLKTQLSEVTVDGKIMAIPWDTAPAVVFYRKDALESLGIKAEDIVTWSEYMEVGRAIHHKSAGKIRMLALNGRDDDKFFRMLLSQLGTGYYTRDRKCELQSETAIRVMSLIKQMYYTGIVYEAADDMAVMEAVKTGEIAALVADGAFAAVLMGNFKELKGKWEVRPLPAFEPGGRTTATFGGSALILTDKASENTAAGEFAKFLAVDRENVIYAVTSMAVFPSVSEYYNETWVDDRIEFYNYQKLWRIIAQTARSRSEIIYAEDFRYVQRQVIEAQRKILYDHEAVSTAMEEAEQNVLNMRLKKDRPLNGR
jgi:ABC-type glycerol-3-phosphate transport system substrate-binding protein